ncbi:MAG: dehypoxanthine futalosine cyclase [Anaerolineaceae bacterium]|nr:dehypoxanthine futalosine cyclase [Anaerolineaceae bacterium]
MTRISLDEALELWRGEDLLALGQRAEAVCGRLHGPRVRTFAIDRNINYTNICTSGCRFCAFYRPSGSSGGYVLSDEQLLAKIAEATERGATHILMQGGLHPGLGLDFAEGLLRKIRERFQVHLHCFSPPEIVHLARGAELDVASVLKRLGEAGLGSLPGGGAEILSDRVRRIVSPNKCTTAEWLEVMRAAHKAGLRTTATMMFGHTESIRERLEHLDHLRRLQDDTGGFTAFICWPFQAPNTRLAADLASGALAAPWTSDGRWRKSGGEDYLRTLAMARIYLDNFQHLQASWVTMGPRLGQLSLRFGADDLGSTMMEENVVRAAGVSHRQSGDELVELIRDAGFEPWRRDCLYSQRWPAAPADAIGESPWPTERN